jgi:CBS domain-containing protein
MKGHARHLMTERVIALAPEMAITDVLRTFAADGLSGAPVLDEDDRVVGFVSETDLLAALLRDPEKMTAGEVMSRPAIVADEFMSTDDVMTLLRESHIHHLPIVREERLVGIITPRDILRYFVERVLPPPDRTA